MAHTQIAREVGNPQTPSRALVTHSWKERVYRTLCQRGRGYLVWGRGDISVMRGKGPLQCGRKVNAQPVVWHSENSNAMQSDTLGIKCAAYTTLTLCYNFERFCYSAVPMQQMFRSEEHNISS